MSNQHGKQGTGLAAHSDVKPGNEQDRQRQAQQGHQGSVEQPGSAADIAKEKHGK